MEQIFSVSVDEWPAMQIQNRECRRMQVPRQLIAIAVTAALTLVFSTTTRAAEPLNHPELLRFSFEEIHMGAPWKITLYAADEATAKHAAAAAYARIEALNRVLSDYDPQSELSRLSDTAPSPEPV